MTTYVEDNPNAFAQRWRLAKKLYMAAEYRLALEHLQILKNEWIPKANVVRYLGATLYRLGRHDEASGILNEAIEVWPNEIAIHEQLARVLEAAGKYEKAISAWQTIISIDSKHTMAPRAVKRLKERDKDENPHVELNLLDSDSGIDLNLGRLCPNCGSQNGSEFDRCWQCHAPLSDQDRHIPTPITQRRRIISSQLVTVISGLIIVALVSFGIFMTLQYAVPPSTSTTDATAYSLVNNRLLMARAVIGLVMLVVWPLSLHATMYFLQIDSVSTSRTNATALFLAALTYALTWVPVEFMVYVPLIPIVASLLLVLFGFGLEFAKSLYVWAIHGSIITAVVLLTIIGFVGTQPIPQLPDILKHLAEAPAVHEFTDIPTGSEFTIKAYTTWSDWLDNELDEAKCELITDQAKPPLVLEIKEGGTTRMYKDVEPVPFRFDFPMPLSPGKEFKMILTGPQGAKASLRILCGLNIELSR